MRQLTFIKKGLVEWHEVPEPRFTAPVQVIVRPFVAVRCDGDCVPLFHSLTNLMNAGIVLHLLDPLVTNVVDPTPFREPFAFGRECIATALVGKREVGNSGPRHQDSNQQFVGSSIKATLPTSSSTQDSR